jgi:hypothetical protein
MNHYLISVYIEDDDDTELGGWMLEVDADTLDEAFDKAKKQATHL